MMIQPPTSRLQMEEEEEEEVVPETLLLDEEDTLALDSQEGKPTLVAETEQFASRILQDKEDHRRLRLVLDEYEETIRLDDIDGFGDTLKLDAEDADWEKGEETLRLEDEEVGQTVKLEEDGEIREYEETLKLDDTEAGATLNFEENEETLQYGQTLKLDDDDTTLGLDELPDRFSPSSQGAHYVNEGNNINEDQYLEQNSSDMSGAGDTQILTQVEDEIRSYSEGEKKSSTASVIVISCEEHKQLSYQPARNGGPRSLPRNKHDEGPNACAESALSPALQSTPCSIGPPLKCRNPGSVRVASLRKAAAANATAKLLSPIGLGRDEQVGRTDEVISPCVTGMHKGDQHELERSQKVRKLLFKTVTQQKHGLLSENLGIDQDKEEQAKTTDFFVSRSDMHYLNSQEPGEESQARALDVVDKFLWMHGGLSQEPCLNYGEMDQASSRTGTKVLSKHLLQVTEAKAADNPMNVFDWTDSQHNNQEAATLLKKENSSKKLQNDLISISASKVHAFGEKIRLVEAVCANISDKISQEQSVPQERRVNAAHGEEEYEIGINTQMAVEAIHMMSREDVEGCREQEDRLVQQAARQGIKTMKTLENRKSGSISPYTSNPKAKQTMRFDAVVTDGLRTCAQRIRSSTQPRKQMISRAENKNEAKSVSKAKNVEAVLQRHNDGQKAMSPASKTRRRTRESAAVNTEKHQRTPATSRKRKEHGVATPDGSARKQRRNITHHVLFSHGLLDNVAKQQQKLLLKLGGEVATDVGHCTHFIADKFTRSINMLEAMAAGKPVVTISWLESSAAAGCFLNESKYILGDAKKEKELGFSMCSTLAAAQQKPLLQGIKVGVTPSTRPPKEALFSIVKAAGGKATGPRGKDIDFVLSCEEDHKICRPLINRGIKIYSPELLLHGIVTYKLELSRFRLFESSFFRDGSVSC